MNVVRVRFLGVMTEYTQQKLFMFNALSRGNVCIHNSFVNKKKLYEIGKLYQ